LYYEKPFEYADLISRTSLATAEISLKHDVVISRVFVTREAYASQDSPFLMNVRKEQVLDSKFHRWLINTAEVLL